MPLQPGTILENRYRVEALLGQGGMGAVYKAFDQRLRMAVALKENSLATLDARAQFEREALTLARLHHSNLPAVTDHFITADGAQYLVMTFIEGANLAELLAARGRQAPADVTSWLGQVCDALTYLHSQNPPIIHRDIKPQNIKITPEGHAFLVDFGLSKVGSTYQSTASGALGVTAGYAPLEQYGSAHTDQRTDVYALTATLYAMLTGEAPPESIKRAVRTVSLTPPRALNHALSPALDRALLHGLEMQPTDRPATVAALRQELEAGLGAAKPASQPPVVPPTQAIPRPSPAPRPASSPARQGRGLPGWTLIGLGAAVVVLLILGVAAVDRGGPTVTPTVVAGKPTKTPTTGGTVNPKATVIPLTATPLPPKDTDTPTRTPTVPPTSTGTPDGAMRLELAPGVTLELVRVTAGEFLMGSDKAVDPDAQDDELPQHRLNLVEYWIGKTEVTNGQFAAFVAATSYKTTAEQEGSGYVFTGSTWEDVKGASWQQPRGPGSDVKEKANYPVMLVSWHDAVAFGQWASQVTGRTVRLPTEAEWEKAARGTNARIYPWGNEAPDASRGNFGMNVKDTTPVGQYPKGASPYGVLDMAGNVWEWTSSAWGNVGGGLDFAYPYNPGDGREDQSRTDVSRVLRGGSWLNVARSVRSALRYRLDPGSRDLNIGFRVASPGL
jgi:formylglycine-generating enzyme required for sulfatase activity/serine/threonine protein kinase